MLIEALAKFFYWNIIINLIFSLSAVLVIYFFKHRLFKLHSKIFGVSEETVAKTAYRSLVTYKTIFVVFNLVPYFALLLIK